MRSWCSELALAGLVLASCAGRAEEACPAPEPPPPPCAPRGSGEWAHAPAGAPQWIPERVSPWARLRAFDATFLVVPETGDARRITYRVGLDTRAISIFGIQPVGSEWARARLEALRGSGELDALLVCTVLPGGIGVRLLPSRESALPRPEGEFFGVAVGGAIVLREGGESFPFDVWAPDDSLPVRARACGRALAVMQSTGEHRTRAFYDGSLACPHESAWPCFPGTWRAVAHDRPGDPVPNDGFVYCEPE